MTRNDLTTSFQTRGEPVYATLQCVAEHGKDVPKELRRTVKQSTHNDRALHRLQQIIRDDPLLNSLVGTTQAIDMIQGGVKSNALPEHAWAIVNRRISVVRFVLFYIRVISRSMESHILRT